MPCAAPASSWRGRGQVPAADEVQNIVTGDEPVLARAGHGLEVDAEIPGQLAHRRCGPRTLPRRGCGRLGFGRLSGADRRNRLGCADRCHRRHRGYWRSRRRGRERAGAAGGPAGGFEDGAVAHEVRFTLGGGGGGAVRTGTAAGIAGAVVPLNLEGDDRLADLDHGAGLFVQGRDHAGERRGQLDDGLGGLHLGDDLVEGDGVPYRDLPGDDFRFRQSFAEVRQPEFLDHCGAHPSSPLRELGRPRARSTPSRILSRPGRWCISSLEYGYGTSKPVTRTGAASRW